MTEERAVAGIPIEVWKYESGMRKILRREEVTGEEATAIVQEWRGNKQGVVVDLATGDPLWRYNLCLLSPEQLSVVLSDAEKGEIEESDDVAPEDEDWSEDEIESDFDESDPPDHDDYDRTWP